MQLDREILALDVRRTLAGKLDDDKIEEVVKQITSLNSSQAKYRADGQIGSIGAYTAVSCQIWGGKTFNGNAGSIPAARGGLYTGNVFTDNLIRLDEATTTFEFHLAVFYFGITFWDSSHNFLGHFESGGLFNCANVGGGPGKWS